MSPTFDIPHFGGHLLYIATSYPKLEGGISNKNQKMMEVTNMKFLSDRTLERRARRRLAKYGLKVRKHREKGGGYTAYSDHSTEAYYFEDGERWFADVFKLLDFTEYLHERYEVE